MSSPFFDPDVPPTGLLGLHDRELRPPAPLTGKIASTPEVEQPHPQDR